MKETPKITPEDEQTELTEKTEKPEKKEKKKSAWKAFLFFLMKLCLIGAAIWLLLIFVFGVFRLSGNNMYPALRDGDLCVTYKLEGYHSGDIVAYRIDGDLRFGRIIAIAGDTVDGDGEGVLLNGQHPSEEIFYPTQILDTALSLPLTLGEGEFLVLNDHRPDLFDSRTYGVIHKDALEGKVIFIFRRRGF